MFKRDENINKSKSKDGNIPRDLGIRAVNYVNYQFFTEILYSRKKEGMFDLRSQYVLFNSKAIGGQSASLSVLSLLSGPPLTLILSNQILRYLFC